MARTARTPMKIAYTGSALNFTAADSVNGEAFGYGGGTQVLFVKNASGSSMNVTMHSNVTTIDGAVVPDHVIAVAAGATVGILEGPTELQADGNVYVDYSAGTSITAVLVQR